MGTLKPRSYNYSDRVDGDGNIECVVADRVNDLGGGGYGDGNVGAGNGTSLLRSYWGDTYEEDPD